MDKQAALSEFLKARKRLELALTLTNEVRTNYVNQITTSNLTPKGQYQPNDNHHGPIVSPVVPDIISKSNYNLVLSRRTYENDCDGCSNINMGLCDGSELGSEHGTPVEALSPTDDHISDDGLSVIPLSK